jgi:hypothetical protein
VKSHREKNFNSCGHISENEPIRFRAGSWDKPGTCRIERAPPGHHFIEHSTEGIQVSLRSDFAARRLFGRHIGYRTHDYPRLCRARKVDGYGQAEVADLGRAVLA